MSRLRTRAGRNSVRAFVGPAMRSAPDIAAMKRAQASKPSIAATGWLSGNTFVAKAPEAVIAKEREKLEMYQEKHDAVESRLADLA